MLDVAAAVFLESHFEIRQDGYAMQLPSAVGHCQSFWGYFRSRLGARVVFVTAAMTAAPCILCQTQDCIFASTIQKHTE